jgi:hypothetical protein
VTSGPRCASIPRGWQMKALAKLVADFVAWRWAPTVAILSAAFIYVVVVVGLVPSEIDVPITNARFQPKPANTATESEPVTVPAMETMPAAAPVPVSRNQSNDFGRRGFSPPLARPDPPPPPPPPPPPVMIPPLQPDVPPPAPEPVAPQAEAEAAVAPPAAPTPPARRIPGLPRNMTGILQNAANALAPITDPNAPPPPSAAPEGSAAPPPEGAPPAPSAPPPQ